METDRMKGGSQPGAPADHPLHLQWDETFDMGARVTINLHEVKTADREEAERSGKEAALKKALSHPRIAMIPTPAGLSPLQLRRTRPRVDGCQGRPLGVMVP